jgi:hypothetical protein
MQLLSLMLDVKPQQSFEQQFWPNYPRKDKKKDAEKAWAALMPDAATVEAIVTALGWQCQQKAWRGERHFIPLPGTYIRGEYWKNEPPPHIKCLLSERRPPQPMTSADREHVWRVQESIKERNRLDLIDAQKQRDEYFRTHPWAARPTQ